MVAIISGVAFIAAIAVYFIYMNTKALPNMVEVSADSVCFCVNGNAVPGIGYVRYTGKNKKHGTLELKVPRYEANPQVGDGIIMALEAISPRKRKSKDRRVAITGVKDEGCVTSFSVGASTFEKNDRGRFVSQGFEDDENRDDENNENIGLFCSGVSFAISGETNSGTTFNYSGNIVFN